MVGTFNLLYVTEMTPDQQKHSSNIVWDGTFQKKPGRQYYGLTWVELSLRVAKSRVKTHEESSEWLKMLSRSVECPIFR